ncbi:hypothetical protein NQ314_020632, partial [Rhamnusium bicolor]
SFPTTPREPLLKKLYVDLSNSRIQISNENLQIVPKTWENINQRRQSSSSEDSGEFDFGNYSFPQPLELGNKIMDERYPCNHNRNSWLKYFMILSKLYVPSLN